MKYTEAFRKLGYRLDSPIQDYSAMNENGVCISIWRDQIVSTKGEGLKIDTRTVDDPIMRWGKLSGTTKRTKHLKHAMDEFNNLIDIVIHDGSPEKPEPDVEPWTRNYVWKVTYLCEKTGHYAAAVKLVNKG